MHPWLFVNARMYIALLVYACTSTSLVVREHFVQIVARKRHMTPNLWSNLFSKRLQTTGDILGLFS